MVYFEVSRNIYTIMKKHPYHDQIIAMAMVMAIDPLPLRLVASGC
jgi:hypothetical protein